MRVFRSKPKSEPLSQPPSQPAPEVLSPAERKARRALYPRFQDALYKAVLTPSLPARAALFAQFNTELAPHLVDDMSYFEMLLAKMAQVYFPAGQAVRAHIQWERRGPSTQRWATHNQLTQIVASRAAPGFSFMFEPTDPASMQACALCFPGTGPAYKRDVLCVRDYPRGVRDDVHWQGAGYEGFMVNRDTWLAQARAVLEQGRELWLVGHSLGAAYASEMMVYLHAQLPEHSHRVHLISIYAPGLRTQTLQSLLPLRARIHRERHRIDVTGWCGAAHPAGTVYTTHDCVGTRLIPFQVPHAVPQGALRRLRGELPRSRIEEVHGVDWHRLRLAEGVRLGASLLLWKRLGY